MSDDTGSNDGASPPEDTSVVDDPPPEETASPDGEAPSDTEESGGSKDFSHLFRSEGLVSDVDLRIDVAKNWSRYVVGDEEVSLTSSVLGANSSMSVTRGSRDRSAGSFEFIVDDEVMMNVGEAVRETVNGGVHLKAAQGAEALVGGAYVNTIAGAYLRLAGWADFLAWGGWAEVDAMRCELSLLMLRSHYAYAHTAGARVTLAGRLIDDFTLRTENFGTLTESGTSFQDAGGPGGGIDNEA